MYLCVDCFAFFHLNGDFGFKGQYVYDVGISLCEVVLL